MPRTFEYRRLVTAADLDELRRVGSQAYAAWMAEAAAAHSAVQGWPPGRYIASGAGWTARRHEIDCLSPALPGDTVVVRTWIAKMERSACERRYEMARSSDGKVLAKALTIWAWVNYKTGKACRVPAEAAAAFS